MCLITSMLKKQGLIVIWGRAHAAAPAHWWILMMSVFLTVCYTNTRLGVVERGRGRGTGVGGRPLSTVFCLHRKLQSQVSRSNSFIIQQSFAAWKYLCHHCSCSSCTYSWRCFIFATFPSLSSIHLFARASLGYLITHLLPEDAAIVVAWNINGKSPQNRHRFAFKIQPFCS